MQPSPLGLTMKEGRGIGQGLECCTYWGGTWACESAAGRAAAEWVCEGEGVDHWWSQQLRSWGGQIRLRWEDQAWSRGAFSLEKREGENESVDYGGSTDLVAGPWGSFCLWFWFPLQRWPVHNVGDGVGVRGMRMGERVIKKSFQLTSLKWSI